MSDTPGPGRLPNGRFLPGNPVGKLGGRPRGVDFRKLVTERAVADGISVEDAMWGVFKSILHEALKGDMQAARLLLDKVADPDQLSLAGVTLAVITGVRDDDHGAAPSPDPEELTEGEP